MNSITRIISLSLVAAAVAGLWACGGTDNSPVSHQDAVDSATSMNKTAMPVQKDAYDFAVSAASGGMMEVELGRLAEQNAASPRVKAFGAMMVKDHTEADQKLKSLAGMKNITLPDSVSDASKKEIEMLKMKKGKAFDKAYVAMMIDDHKTDIADFRKAADGCSDSVLKSFAGSALPTLEKHLDSIQAIAGTK